MLLLVQIEFSGAPYSSKSITSTCTHISCCAGDQQLRGDEAPKMTAFKEALGLSDEEAAPVHIEVARRLFRQVTLISVLQPLCLSLCLRLSSSASASISKPAALGMQLVPHITLHSFPAV